MKSHYNNTDYKNIIKVTVGQVSVINNKFDKKNISSSCTEW